MTSMTSMTTSCSTSTVLSSTDGNVTTATLLAEVGSGRYRAQPGAGGTYLKSMPTEKEIHDD
jgi:hypothetical protein